MISVKKTLYKVAEAINALKTDYVTEEGSSGAWRYRKWSSGKVEAWAALTLTSKTPTAWVSPVRYIDDTVTIPSEIFSTTPVVMAMSKTNQLWIVTASATNATTIPVRFATVASSAQTGYVVIYAWTY